MSKTRTRFILRICVFIRKRKVLHRITIKIHCALKNSKRKTFFFFNFVWHTATILYNIYSFANDYRYDYVYINIGTRI